MQRAPERITRTGVVKSSFGGDASRGSADNDQIEVIGEEIGKDDDATLTHETLHPGRGTLLRIKRAQQSAGGASHLPQWSGRLLMRPRSSNKRSVHNRLLNQRSGICCLSLIEEAEGNDQCAALVHNIKCDAHKGNSIIARRLNLA